MIKRTVVTGSLSFDHIMSMPGKFSDHIMPDKIHILNVSFIMQTFRKGFGGTGGNIAYSLALLKVPTLIVSSVGNDFKDYLKHLKGVKKLDTSGISVFKGEQTAQGFVATDKNDNQIWGFYQGAMQKANKISLNKFLKKGDFVVIAPNDPVAMLKYVKDAVKKGIPYMFDPAFNIPHFAKKDLSFAVKNATIVIGNDYEIELIKRKLGIKTLPKNKQIWITTLGPKGSQIVQGASSHKVSPAKPKNTSDPTRAGDAYRAGFIAGYVQGLPLAVCGEMGSLASVYTVEKYGTQTHKFTTDEFTKRYKANFEKNLNIKT